MAESTIFRFCKRIGFKGFQELKISLASETVIPAHNIYEEINENDDIATITRKSFSSNLKTIEDTLSVQNFKKISKVVELLINADKVQFFGVGGSAFIALDAYHKFIRSGINVFANLDSHLQIMSASQMISTDLAIIISHSGSTKDMLDIFEVLKDNNVQVVVITNFAKSPLTEKSDISLYTVAEETEFRSDALSSRLSQLSIIDALYVNVMIKNKHHSGVALNKIRNSINLKRL